jgi:hypothetical protein
MSLTHFLNLKQEVDDLLMFGQPLLRGKPE